MTKSRAATLTMLTTRRSADRIRVAAGSVPGFNGDQMDQEFVASLRDNGRPAVRAKVPIDAPIGPTNYARMFPELPSFEADDEFLRRLGRAGGLCDCGERTIRQTR